MKEYQVRFNFYCLHHKYGGIIVLFFLLRCMCHPAFILDNKYFSTCKHHIIVSTLLFNSDPRFRNIKIANCSFCHNLQNFSLSLHSSDFTLVCSIWVSSIFYFLDISRQTSAFTVPTQSDDVTCLLYLLLNMFCTNIIHSK